MKRITVQATDFAISRETRERIDTVVNEVFSGEDAPARVEVQLDGSYPQNRAITYAVTIRAVFSDRLVFAIEHGGHLLDTVDSAVKQLRVKLGGRTQPA